MWILWENYYYIIIIILQYNGIKEKLIFIQNYFQKLGGLENKTRYILISLRTTVD